MRVWAEELRASKCTQLLRSLLLLLLLLQIHDNFGIPWGAGEVYNRGEEKKHFALH